MSAESRLSTREILHEKSDFFHSVREFFQARAVTEVITSLLRRAPPTDLFLDHYQCSAHQDPETFYLHSSPEYAMKSLIIQGSGDIYQICQVARGNEAGIWHSKAFTMLEWYRLELDLPQLMQEVVDLISLLYQKKLSPITLSYQQSYTQALNIDNIHTIELAQLQNIFHKKQIDFAENWQKDDFLYYCMTHFIEPSFQSMPLVLVYDFPASQAALAKCKQNVDGITVADRFEVYSYGIEIGNGYNELTDYAEHVARFEQDQISRQQHQKPCYPIDQDFLSELKQGMPSAVGIAMGLDRIFALKKGAKGLLA